MVKKIVRTRTIQNTISQAKKLLNKGVPKTKKITRTRSIEKTIAESKEYETLLRLKQDKKNRELRREKVAQRRKSRLNRTIQNAKIKQNQDEKSSERSKKDVQQSDQSVQQKNNSIQKINNHKVAKYGTIDICFCLDATASMGSYLDQAKQTVSSIIKKIQSQVKTSGIELRFAVVTYRDHPPQENSYVTTIKDFTNEQQIRNYMKLMNATGGGDQPQAVLDGLLDCAKKLSWKNNKNSTLRYVFHIADAPPHGNEFLNNELQKGCTCGLQTDLVTKALNSLQIHYRLIKVGENAKVNQMDQIFKKSLTNMQSTTINKANQMDGKVTNMILKELISV